MGTLPGNSLMRLITGQRKKLLCELAQTGAILPVLWCRTRHADTAVKKYFITRTNTEAKSSSTKLFGLGPNTRVQATPTIQNSKKPSRAPSARTLTSILEIARAARQIDFDPVSKFRFSFGDAPRDLLSIIDLAKCDFENFVKARSISPYLEEPVFIMFTSAKITPAIGGIFEFNGEEISLLDPDTLQPKRLKGRSITEVEFLTAQGGMV
jgi:hypothetical protein